MLVIVQWGVFIFPQSTQVIRSIFRFYSIVSWKQIWRKMKHVWSFKASWVPNKVADERLVFTSQKKEVINSHLKFHSGFEKEKKKMAFMREKRLNSSPFCQVPFSQWCRQIWRLAWYVAMLEETINSTPFCTLKKLENWQMYNKCTFAEHFLKVFVNCDIN